MALIANQLFGNSKDDDPNRESSANENVFHPKSAAEMVMAFKSVFKNG